MRSRLRKLTASLPGVTPVQPASARVVAADFWSRLLRFAQLGFLRKGWEGVDSTHPIISVENVWGAALRTAASIGAGAGGLNEEGTALIRSGKSAQSPD